MNRLFRSLIFGDVGNKHHPNEAESNARQQRNNIRSVIRTNYEIDEDQEKRIIHLEVLCGTLIAILKEKEILTTEEIDALLKTAEESALDVKTI